MQTLIFCLVMFFVGSKVVDALEQVATELRRANKTLQLRESLRFPNRIIESPTSAGDPKDAAS